MNFRLQTNSFCYSNCSNQTLTLFYLHTFIVCFWFAFQYYVVIRIRMMRVSDKKKTTIWQWLREANIRLNILRKRKHVIFALSIFFCWFRNNAQRAVWIHAHWIQTRKNMKKKKMSNKYEIQSLKFRREHFETSNAI